MYAFIMHQFISLRIK